MGPADVDADSAGADVVNANTVDADVDNADINEVFASQEFSGNGAFTKRVQEMLEEILGAERVLLTHSCTGALEMAALLAGFGPGDEVLVPSYTFVTSASSIMRTGATPVFCEVDENLSLIHI